jgi:hypothetical protein
MFTKKNSILNLFGDRLLFRIIGFSFSLAILFVAFSFTTFKTKKFRHRTSEYHPPTIETIVIDEDKPKEAEKPIPKSDQFKEVPDDFKSANNDLIKMFDNSSKIGDFDLPELQNKDFPDIDVILKDIDIPLEVVEAEFIGGNTELHNFIKKHLVYPKDALVYEMEGIVTVVFEVYANGSVKIIGTEGDKELSFVEEAKRVISMTDRHWIPAHKGKKTVKTICKIPISFELNQ